MRMNLLQLIRYYDSETQQHLKIKIIEEVASNWEEVAGQLGFTPGVIVAVKNPGCGKTPDACFKEILRRWMANATGMPNADRYPCTWRGIHALLIDTTHTTVANDLKEAIEATYTDFKKTYDEGILHFRSTYVTVYRKTRHNAAPFEKNFFCTYRVVGVQILSSPSFIVVA